MSVRIVQLTDLHLYEQRDRVLAGVPTWETFDAVLEQVRERHADLDYLILTGDLAQDEAPQTYMMLREALGEWLPRCRIIPGNHDDPVQLRRLFPELFHDAADRLTFDLDTGGWTIIGLDSHVPGDVKGRVGAAQLEWVRALLAGEPDRPTLIFIHHPPVPLGVAWLDSLGLLAAQPLVSLIEGSPQVKLVCAGHVHQAWSGEIGSAAIQTTPSTCVQFGARAEKSFDRRAAGYRTITLEPDGRFETDVHRLPAAP